jgi:hypothetical protein
MLLVGTALTHVGPTDCLSREELHAAMEDLTRSNEAIRVPDRDEIKKALSAAVTAYDEVLAEWERMQQ